MIESIKINELRAALKQLLESGEFAGTSSHAIMARMPSMQGDKNLRALATIKARALLSQDCANELPDDDWIPVEVRLPDNDDNVIISFDDGRVSTGFYAKKEWSQHSAWFDSDICECAGVIAWKPMPAGYDPKAPAKQFTDGIKAVDLVWFEGGIATAIANTPFGNFLVRHSEYREGYSAYFKSELLDLNQSTDNPITKDQAKFLCQVASQAMVFQLIERK